VNPSQHVGWVFLVLCVCSVLLGGIVLCLFYYEKVRKYRVM
jgi:hypothetical protein